MSRLIIFLKEQESNALLTLAESQYRDPRAQAALIIREALEWHGLLQSPNDITQEQSGNRHHQKSHTQVGNEER